MKLSRFVSLALMGLVTAGLLLGIGCQPVAEQDGEPAASAPEAAAPESAGTSEAPSAAPSTQPAAPSTQRAAAPPPTQPPAPSARQAVPQTAVPEPPAPPAPRTATLAEGTALKVRTTTTVSTQSHETGDTFSATLEEDITEGDWVIAPKGSRVEGRVVEADPGGRVQGVARLTVALSQLQTPDGQAIDLTTNTITVEAQTTKKEDAAKVGIGAGIGAAIGAIAGGGKGAATGAAAGAGAGTGVVLATRGDPAEIGSETLLTFELRSPVTVTEKK